MIRYAKHSGVDYIIVDSSFDVNGVHAPLHIQINLTNVPDKERLVVYRTIQTAFNRHISFTKKPKIETNKVWWKFWSN